MVLSKKQITLETYNKSAQQLAEYFSGIDDVRRKLVDKAFALSGLNNPKVLEIGCGDGRDAEYILTKTKNYCGFDLSERMVKLAKKRLPQVDFFVSDLEGYNCEEKYDLIFSLSTLVHIDKTGLQIFLEKMINCLTVDGLLVIDLKMSDKYKEEFKKDQFGKRVFYYYPVKLIRKYISKQYKIEYLLEERVGKTNWLSIIARKKHHDKK